MSSVCDPNELAMTDEPTTDEQAQERPLLDLPEGMPRLNSFYLYMSNGCNLKCRHCWITPRFVDGEPSPGDVIDMGLLREAVEEGKTLGLSSAKLTGGEPMLHPQFIEIVKLLTEQDLNLVMETNGTLVTKEMAYYLRHGSNMHFVSVSIDGATAASHDKFRGVEGAFEGVLRGLDNLVDAGYGNVQVIMCPHRGNMDEVDAVVQLAVDHGATSVKFNPVTNSGRGEVMHAKDETLSFEETMDFVRYVRGDLQAKTSISIMTMTPPALTTMRELWVNRDGTGACGVRHILGFLGTGEIALCGIGRTIPELIYGHLGQDSIRDIWLNSPALHALRRDLDDYENFPGVCSECVHAKDCLTSCVANNYVNSGHLTWPSMLCEQAEQRGVFPASRRLKKAEAPRMVRLGEPAI